MIVFNFGFYFNDEDIFFFVYFDYRRFILVIRIYVGIYMVLMSIVYIFLCLLKVLKSLYSVMRFYLLYINYLFYVGIYVVVELIC